MRAAIFVVLCGLSVGCPVTDPRPFGLEKKTVTLIAGEAEMVGFRVAWKSGDPLPSSVVKPEGLTADLNSFVQEDDAVAGGVTLHASLRTPPGAYAVTVQDQLITVNVVELPAVLNEPRATRRSTVGLTDALGVGTPATMAALNEDGTVWEVLSDGGVGRLELVSGVTAVAQYGNGFSMVNLDGPWVDVRATQSEKEELHADGTVVVDGTTKSDVAAIRPYFIGATVQNTLRVFLLKDGRVDGVETQTISRAVDVIPLGNTFLRSDGVVFETSSAVGLLEPVFVAKGLREFEGSAFETFANQQPEFRHHSLWRTPDGIAWGLASNRDTPQGPRALIPPAGVEVRDVFARGRAWYLLGTDGRLYNATGGQVGQTPLPFRNVRAAAAAPDVGVFSDGIPFLFGESMTVPLRVRRAGFDGALTLTPRGLPADVTIAPVAIEAGATTASFTITFGSTGVVRPLELEFALTGEGLARTTLLSVELPRVARRMTVAQDLAVKRDGTVWRFTPGPPVQLPGLANIISITDNMALDADGVVYSFGDNSVGQLGRTTVGVIDPTPTAVPGLPPIVAIARCTIGNNLSMALDRDGRVWRFGQAVPCFDARRMPK